MLRFPARRPPSARPALRLVTPEAEGAPAQLISSQAAALVIVTALFVGALIRISFVAAAAFPLGDGGMFHAMSTDLAANGYALPRYTSYNFGSIPYAYPPLGFYATALLADFTPMGVNDALRLLPLAASLGTMLAFALLARRMLDDRAALAAAIAAFALSAGSFEWMIMGGGVTRSLGFMFATLALHEAHRLFVARQRWAVITLGVLAGLAALSHLEKAWVLSFSAILLLVYEGHWRESLHRAAVAAAIAAAVSSPWWVTVLMQHGPSPFIAAATTSSPSPVNPAIAILFFRATTEPMFALIAALALLGIVWCLGNRRWYLPLWVLACGLLDARAFANGGALPVSMLAGIACAHVLLPMLLRPGEGTTDARRWALPIAVFSFLALYAAIAAMVGTPRLLVAVTPDERAAMTWVQANTEPDAEILVVSNELWATDRTSEWLPVLAERRSVATVQGYEWIRGAFGEKLRAFRALQQCATNDASCVDEWRAEYGTVFDYLYLPKLAQLQRGLVRDPFECCFSLRQSLRADERYRVVYDGPGATIFRREQ